MKMKILTVSWAKANWEKWYGWDKFSKTHFVESGKKTMCGKEIPERSDKRDGHYVDFDSFTFYGGNAQDAFYEEHCLRCVKHAKNKIKEEAA